MSTVDQAKPDTAGVVAPPPLVFALPLIVGLAAQWWRPLPVLSPGLAAPIGIGILALGLVGAPAILAFRRAKTSPRPWRPATALVTSGPFRFTRNPMYLGFTMIYLGIALWVNTAWPLFLLPFVLALTHYGVILREEAYLARRFGDEYLSYQRRVRRWL